jgi:3-deoxy-7-phosphoheptulonate synthase
VTLSTDDIRIREIKPLITPSRVIGEFPQTQISSATVTNCRIALSEILHQADGRLAVVVGPCSIHDPQAAMEYAERLRAVRNRLSGELEIVMRVYFAKPRTTIGWKGLINDPDLDGSFNIDDGLRIARKLLLEVNQLGVPVGSEFLDIVAPQYLSDLVVPHSDFAVLIPSHSRIGKLSGGTRISMLLGRPG